MKFSSRVSFVLMYSQANIARVGSFVFVLKASIDYEIYYIAACNLASGRNILVLPNKREDIARYCRESCSRCNVS